MGRRMMMDTGAGKSDMNGWSDGVAYTDLEIVKNSYVTSGTGSIQPYNGWDRTGYVPCNGCSSITFPPMPQRDATRSNRFYDVNKNPLSNITLSQGNTTNITVPEGAYYFIISSTASAVASCINAGIVPHA